MSPFIVRNVIIKQKMFIGSLAYSYTIRKSTWEAKSEIYLMQTMIYTILISLIYHDLIIFAIFSPTETYLQVDLIFISAYHGTLALDSLQYTS